MAIQRYVGDRITCLSADTKPTSMQDGAIALETDTSKWFQLSSGSWVEINDPQIAVNTGDIATNATDIATNATDISTVDGLLDTHTGDTSNPHQVALEQARAINNALSGDVDYNNNSIDNLSGLTFSGGSTLEWNSEFYTVDVPTGLGPVNQVGQELYTIIYNNTGSQIDNGKVVRVTSVAGGYPSVELAQADNSDNLGGNILITTMDIPNASVGVATRFGNVSLDTTSFGSPGPLWISPTVAGDLTRTRPEFPYYAFNVGGVESVAVDGKISIQINSSIFDTFDNAWDGTFRESIDFLVSVSGGTIYGSLDQAGGSGGDLTMVFSDGLSILDCTPAQTIALTGGTDTNPQLNYVYVPKSTKALTVSTSDWPSDEHIKVADLFLGSVSGTSSDGALVNRNWNDHVKSAGDNGHIPHITERLRQNNAEWDSGVAGTCTISAATNSDVYVSNTSGKVYQLHKQTFPAYNTNPDISGDELHIVNNNATPYFRTNNLNTETVDALGNTLANKSFSFVLWGVQNKTGEESHLMINLPTGSYAKNDPDAAVNDSLNHSVYEIPRAFKGKGFLIARFTCTLASNGTDWTLYDTEDLRGKIPNATAGGGAGGTGVVDFTELTDTPSSYTGNGGQSVRVNAGETALEFVDDGPQSNSGSTVLDMSNYNGNYVNMNSASTATTYTTTGQVLGGYAVVRINAASEPTVTSATKIAGSTFSASTDMHMYVQYFGDSTQYFFGEL